MALGGKHPYYGRKASLVAGSVFNPSAAYHGRPHMTPRQIRRVTKRVNRNMGATAIHFPHLRVKEPKIAGAHPLHSAHFHMPTGARLTPHVPSVHVRDPIHLRLHPTASLGVGHIESDIKKIGKGVGRDIKKIERKVI